MCVWGGVGVLGEGVCEDICVRGQDVYLSYFLGYTLYFNVFLSSGEHPQSMKLFRLYPDYVKQFMHRKMPYKFYFHSYYIVCNQSTWSADPCVQNALLC